MIHSIGLGVSIACLALCAVVLRPLKVEVPGLTDVLEPLRAEFDVPALGGAIVVGGRVVAIGAVGVRRNGAEGDVGVDDAWALGSCTKAMTAAVLARLVEKDALRWDATLAELFPERVERMQAFYRSATVRQLVDHRAGLPEDLTSGTRAEQLLRSRAPVTEQRLRKLDEALACEPLGRPGTVHAYSNAGFVIAGAVIERVTGESWEVVVRRELFGPLDMNSAEFGAPGAGGADSQPWGHREAEIGGRPVDPSHVLAAPPAWYGPAGTVHASLADWAKFASLHLGVTELLRPETLSSMHTPSSGAEYACGFGIGERDWASGPALALRGASGLWRSTIRLSPTDGFAVLVVCNQGGERAARACEAAAEALLALARNEQSAPAGR